ncbi:MAG: ABC transporter permease subunit [Clostridia bacterium]|nr:ABC transporter permease subunit [Clostridia bacterium]
MKKWGIAVILAALLLTLLLPGMNIYVHSKVDAEIAAAFPGSVPLGGIMLRGADCLPADKVPSLHLMQTGNVNLLAGVILTVLAGAVLFTAKKRAVWLAGLALGLAGIGCCFTFGFQMQNLSDSLLFGLLVTPQVWCWAPTVCALALLVLGLFLRPAEPLGLSDTFWRKAGAVLAVLALLCVLLPFAVVHVPETVTDNPEDAARMNRTTSLLSAMTAGERNLRSEKDEGAYANVLSGDIGEMAVYSGDENNVKGVFLIGTATESANPGLLIAAVLLLAGAVLAFIPKVDRWFVTACQAGATVGLLSSVIGLISVTDADMYSAATRQLIHLGVGGITPLPVIMLLLALGAFLCEAAGIRVANEPYFVNPIPKRKRNRVIALVLAALSLAAVLLPAADISFYKPGKTKIVSSAPVSTFDSMIFRGSEALTSPADNKGKPVYPETADEGELTAEAAGKSILDVVRKNGICSWAAVALILAGMFECLPGRKRKLAAIFFLGAFAARAAQWITLAFALPAAIGTADIRFNLYISLPLLLYAAFMTKFTDMDEVPKKYRLFLMLTPFLAAVFLFSYLPLAGWRYAFYNYKFGLPMNQQEFVGFKWFTEMVTNEGHRTNIVRVMKNTLGMSMLGLVTSWLPMFFAIFLNEMGNRRFKRFVQIFTTLPNFISWALVFAFAMAMFAMDTGIYSKFMLATGAIDKPVAWLNSGDNIWLKMWGWGLWKGLGWNAIMYLAAISGIDQEMYEAAKVDGANRWNIIRHITLPSLLPTFFVLLLLSISNIINNGMEQYLVFQNPMNKNTIEVLDLYVYNITIASRGTTLYSFGTAIGILKTLVSVILLFSANFASKKLRGESIV